MLSEFDAAAAAAADVPVVPAEAVEVVNYAATALANADAPRRAHAAAGQHPLTVYLPLSTLLVARGVCVCWERVAVLVAFL